MERTNDSSLLFLSLFVSPLMVSDNGSDQVFFCLGRITET